jgi:two-component system, OmpR family, sensor kinase
MAKPQSGSARQDFSQPDGQPDVAIAACEQTAVDPRDQLIQDLHDAIASRDQFLAIAAHELRNPLTPIVLGLQLIRAAEESDDRGNVRNELERLERQIKRFIARTNVLLEVAQINAGKFHLELSTLDLSELTMGIVSDYMPLVTRSGSEIKVLIKNGVIALLDRMAVSEIVENLLSNAIKYGQHKPIEITLTATAQAAQLVVRDNGIGIDNKDIVRIFEPFERAVGREVHSGFGIGLWLSRSLAELMGGSITVSAQPGAGSIFTVSLPIQPWENP